LTSAEEDFSKEHTIQSSLYIVSVQHVTNLKRSWL